MPGDPPDRRRQPREAVRGDVWLGDDDVFTRHAERIRDLSLGGAFLDLEDVPLAVGDVVKMRFRLGRTGDFITCSAKVRNTRDPRGVGVEFLDLESHARERIRAFVDPEA